jgi:hypothetical protein
MMHLRSCTRRPIPVPPVRRRRPPAAAPGPDTYIVAPAYGYNYDLIKAAALEEARRFYGPQAALTIVTVGPIERILPSRGPHADVTVRCTNFAEIALR